MEKIVLDFEIKGRVVGIEIYSDASRMLDLPFLKKAGLLQEQKENGVKP